MTSRPERLIKIISTRYFLVIKEINRYLVDMILINSFWSGFQSPIKKISDQIDINFF
jgi:hypothetical protein